MTAEVPATATVQPVSSPATDLRPARPALRLLYRATPGTNRKRRPEWFSKWLCLGSMLRAVEAAPPGAVGVTFLADGRLPGPVEAAMERFGPVEHLDGLGNSGSYLYALDGATAAGLPEHDAVYLVEDDYLHLPEALAALLAALDEAPAHSYFTLYDHPDRYTRTDDLRTPGPTVQMLGGRHWRRVESTNMTFATTVGTLRRDHRLHTLAARFTSCPHDRALWRTVQGLGVRRPLRLVRGDRMLLGAVPSLATHCEQGLLAPAVAWDDVARSTVAWMQDRGLGAERGW